VSELKTKLAERRFSPSVISQTVEYLSSLGYLDDEAFARGRARYLMESKPMGRRRLAWELTQKGLGRKDVEAAVEEAWEGRSEQEVALEVASRRMASYRDLPETKAKRRLKGYLERRGFSAADIFSVMEEIFSR
jgi:regulatory protein